MARKLVKKWIVDTVDFPDFGFGIPISIDPADGSFWANYPDDELIVRKTKDACRLAVKEAVIAHNKLEWTPFIAVHLRQNRFPDDPPASVVMLLYRYEMAVIEREQPHPYLNEMVKKRVERFRPFGGERGNQRSPWTDHIVLPYSDELWERLKGIEDTILMVKEALTAILTKQKEDTDETILARIMGAELRLPGPVPEPPQLPKKRKQPPPPPTRK